MVRNLAEIFVWLLNSLSESILDKNKKMIDPKKLKPWDDTNVGKDGGKKRGK